MPRAHIATTSQPPNSERAVRLTSPRVISRTRLDPGPHQSTGANARPGHHHPDGDPLPEQIGQ